MENTFGKLTRADDGYVVKFERLLKADIRTVWAALTDPEKLRIWFTDIELDFRPGGHMTIRFRDEAHSASSGEIVAIEAPYRFVFSWEGELAVWELEDAGPGLCKLTLTYSKLADQYAQGAAAGFHTLLHRLEKMLGGSRETYAFGTEENDPEQLRLRKAYGEIIFLAFPELKRFAPVEIEKKLNASVTRVWQALTDKDQMKAWYFDLSDFKAEVGFAFSFYGQGHKGEQYLHQCVVTAVIPEQQLTYSWQYAGHEGISHVTFVLEPSGEGTLLKLTHQGLGSFPAGNPDFARDSFLGGWTELITRLLPAYLEKQA